MVSSCLSDDELSLPPNSGLGAKDRKLKLLHFLSSNVEILK